MVHVTTAHPAVWSVTIVIAVIAAAGGFVVEHVYRHDPDLPNQAPPLARPESRVSEGEVIVHVSAAPLKNVDKMMASGSHYDHYRELPVICGLDGVGTLDDGTRVYCGGSRLPYGMMAERTVVSWSLPIPDALDASFARQPYCFVRLLPRKRGPDFVHVSNLFSLCIIGSWLT
jgi:hypothetical protein